MDTNLNQSPIASGSQMPQPESQHRTGPLAGVVIIIVLLIAAGLYFWGAKLSKESAQNLPPYIPGDTAEINAEIPQTTGLPVQSTSDDPASIEADFQSANFDAIEAQAAAGLDNL